LNENTNSDTLLFMTELKCKWTKQTYSFDRADKTSIAEEDCGDRYTKMASEHVDEI